MSSAILKKITVRDVCGKIAGELFARIVAAKGEEVPLMRVIGIARRFKVGTAMDKEFIRFIGSFKATDLQTGKTAVSGQCILPGAIPDMLYGQLSADGTTEVQFGFEIGARYDETVVTKYSYTVKSLVEMGEADPLSLLESKINAPALPAPPAPPAADPVPPAADPAAKEGKAKK